MPQHRTNRSNAPSPSPHTSKPSTPFRDAQTPPLETKTLPDSATREEPQQPHASTSASATTPTITPSPTNLLTLTFHWRCCRSSCLSLIRYTTDTHFAHLVRPRGGRTAGYWVPVYRLRKCAECRHRACGVCLLLQVEWGQCEDSKGEGSEDGRTANGDCQMARRDNMIYFVGGGEDCGLT